MRRIAFIALIALALVALAAPAAARTKYKTTTSFSYSPLLMAGFFGQLSSPNSDCLPHRKVSVLKVRSGPDKTIGTDRTKPADNGDWFVPWETAGSSKYYAKVKARDLAGGDICRSTRTVAQSFF